MSRIVEDFYNKNVVWEWERLDTQLPKIEFATALRLIETYFPATGAACDIVLLALEDVERAHPQGLDHTQDETKLARESG